MKIRNQAIPKLKLLLLLIAGVVFSHGVATAQVIWSDEFNSGSAPDSSVWTAETGGGGWGNSEMQVYTSDPANVRVEGGNLIITAIATPASKGRPGSQTFTSARIKTEDKLTFKYGTIEARIKIPDLADGLWPAFWTLGNNFSSVGWPDCGELDILEMGYADAIAAGVVNRRVGSTAHWDYQGSYAFYTLAYDAASDIAGDGNWHTIRMEWTPTLIETFIDGNWVWAFDISNPSSFSGEEFHQHHFITLNLAVGGSLTGITTSSDITAPSPAEYMVDWIRISDNGFTVLGGSSIGGPNLAPSFSTDPVVEANAAEGSAYSASIADDASDPEGDAMTFSKVSGPAWLSVAANGALSGTPGAGDVGLNSFTVQVDATGGSDTATLEITVDAAGSVTDVYIANIAMSSASYGGNRISGIATITVLDDSGSPASGATVSVDWSGATSSSDSASTDGGGVVVFESGKIKNGGTYTVTVTDVTGSGYNYNPALNIETSDSITAP